MTESDPSNFEQRLRARDPVVGHWLSIGHPAVAEVCARDADFAVVDTEHAPTDLESVANVVRAIQSASDARTVESAGDARAVESAGDGTPTAATTAALARVAWNDPVRIKRVLDTGVAGVVVPMVESAGEARQAVRATRYPPEGIRGIAGSRANDYGRDLAAQVDADSPDPTVVVQVETESAVENAGDVAAVEGVDALLVGPADLSGSLGVFGEYEGDRFRAAVTSVLDAAHESDTPVGTLATTDDEIRLWADYGYDYQVVGVDAGYLAAGAERAQDSYRDAME